MNGAETKSPEGAGAAPEENSGQTPRNPNEWQMPTPVFQQTSGYLPQGYIEQFGAAVPKQGDQPPAAAPEPAASSAPADVAIEPQPDLAEQLEDQADVPTPPAAPQKKKSGIGRILLVLLGVSLMILFLAGFLLIIYFLFIAPEGTGSIF